MSALNAETGLPGSLDVLLRDLHIIWCPEDHHDEPEWELVDADPARAALTLCTVLWWMAEDPTPDEAVALDVLSDAIERAQATQARFRRSPS